MRYWYIIFGVICFSCAKPKSTSSKVKPFEPAYHYQKESKETIEDKATVSYDQQTNDTDTSIAIVEEQEETALLKKKPKTSRKKIHMPSVGSVAAEATAFGSYFLLKQTLGKGLLILILLDVVSLLATLLSITVGFLAYQHFVKNSKKFKGSGFSIFVLYSSILLYLLLSIVGSALLIQIGIPSLVLWLVSLLVGVAYTIYFFKVFLKTLKKP